MNGSIVRGFCTSESAAGTSSAQPHAAAQHRLERQRPKQAQVQLVPAARHHADKINHQKHGLPGKKEIVVEQVDRNPKRECTVPAVQHSVIQRFEHVGEQRHNVQKVVKEHVVHRKAGERIQTCAHHAPALVFYPAAHPQVSPAARHSKFKAEHWHHGPGHPPIGQQQGEPEKRLPHR